jgi:hypothetical protein
MVRETGTILQKDFMIKPQNHFFGDSFTAGDEIVDHKYVESYPPYLNFREWFESKDKSRPSLHHLSKSEYESLIKEERQNSYAGIVEGINHAESGMSLQNMCRLIVNTLESAKTKQRIFIQPSGIERWCEFVDGQWTDFNTTPPKDQHKDYYKFRVSHSTESSNFEAWQSIFLPLISYVSHHHNTLDWFIINNGTLNELIGIIDREKLQGKGVLNAVDHWRQHIINFPQVDAMDEPFYCKGGHVNQKAHKILADKISKLLVD